MHARTCAIHIMTVYKGGGKDPLKVDSFWGVTLTSTLAKVIEFLIMDRLQLFLLEAGLPHVNQSEYRREISCAEAILQQPPQLPINPNAIQLLQEDRVLEWIKCFFQVIQTHVYLVATMHVPCYRFLCCKDWYCGLRGCVRLNGHKSREFPVMRGIRQGSVMSPILFLMAMVLSCNNWRSQP